MNSQHPLTTSQLSVWLDQQLHIRSARYNISAWVVLPHEVEDGQVEAALRQLVSEADVLRTRFFEEDGLPGQEFLAQVEFPLERVDFQSFSDPKASAQNWMESQNLILFDLLQPPLFACAQLKINPEESWVYLRIHHLITDGYGLSLLTHRFGQILTAQIRKTELSPSPFTPYADFIAADQAYLQSEEFRKDKAYWQEKLAQLPDEGLFAGQRNLHSPNPRPECSLDLEGKRLAKVESFCKEQQVSPFHFFLACLYLNFRARTGAEEILLSSPILNRGKAAFKRSPGLFQGLLPLRIRAGEPENLLDLLRNIRQELKETFRYQKFPLYGLHRTLAWEKSPAWITLSWEKFNFADEGEAGFTAIHPLPIPEEAGELSIHIGNYGREEGIQLNFSFNGHRWSTREIEDFVRHFDHIIDRFLSLPETRVSDFQVLIEEELTWQWEELGLGNALTYPLQTVLAQFAQIVKGDPEGIAFQVGENSLTRAEFDEKSTLWAAKISSELLSPGSPVALLLPAGLQRVVAIWAVMKAGFAWLPLDPTWPAERIRFMLQDSRAELLIMEEENPAMEAGFSGKIWLTHALDAQSDRLLVLANPTLDDPAYLIYTSGSTGEPKGVWVSHGNLAAFGQNLGPNLALHPGGRLLALTNYTFDISVLELVCALAQGISLVLPPPGGDAYLPELLASGQVDYLQITPSRLSALISGHGMAFLEHLQVILVGGEAMSGELFSVLCQLQNPRIFNVYGPTESTIWSSFKELKDGVLTAGKALDGEQIHILSQNLRPKPLGSVGEICISGAGVAMGYHHRPQLTKERFVPHPSDPQKRLYRTGDLGRWNEMQELEVLGRLDDQIKLRGFRIELGEIEAALLQHPEVREAVVVAPFLHETERQLVGYFTAEKTVEVGDLEAFLQAKLPTYMVPQHLFQLGEIPLNSSGKADRRALNQRKIELPAAGGVFVPQNDREQQLLKIWQEVLQKQEFGADDGFFPLGGHSLKAAQLMARIRTRLGISLEMADIFAAPSLAAQSALLRSRAQFPTEEIPLIDEAPSYPLSPSQQRLWVLENLTSGTGAYHMAAAFHLLGPFDREKWEKACKALVKRHEVLRTRIILEDGEPRQVILTGEDFVLETENPKLVSAEKSSLDRLLQAEIRRPFDLEHEGGFRVKYYPLPAEKGILLVNLHHLFGDDFTLRLLKQELTSLLEDDSAILPPSKLRFRDVAAWQMDRSRESDRQFWLNLPGLSQPLPDLPLDFPRPAIRTYQGQTMDFFLSQDLWQGLEKLAGERGVTPFMVVLALTRLHLQRLTGHDSVRIGTPVQSRNHPDLEVVAGPLLNTLVLPFEFLAEDRFYDLLDRTRQNLLQVYPHQDYPLEDLVRELEVSRDASRNPLFDVFVVWLEGGESRFQAGDLRIEKYPLEQGISKFDLSYYFRPIESGLKISLEYRTDLFAEETVKAFGAQLECLTGEVLHAPDQILEELEWIPSSERKILQEQFAPGPPLPSSLLSVVADFEAVTALRRGETALEFGGESWTFAQLDAISATWAAHLLDSGLERGGGVGILLPRGPEWVFALWGILRAGGAFLPLDAQNPSARNLFLLQQAGAKHLITTAGLALETDFSGRVFVPDELNQPQVGMEILPEIPLTQKAYTLFTSGSTGEPKGVDITHQNLAAFGCNLESVWGFLPGQTLFSLTNLTFDISILELVLCLSKGISVYLATDSQRREPDQFLQVLQSGQVNLLQITPSHLQALTSGKDLLALENLDTILVGGEAMPESLHTSLLQLQNPQVFNVYGPTETTIWSSSFRLGTGSLSLGNPLSGEEILILSPSGKLQPPGVAGEICIAGAGLSPGYAGRSDLTVERFVSHPFQPGKLIYKTGDLGRWKRNGEIEFLGRMDAQLKVRGMRVEPGEIEQAMLGLSQISEAKVLALPDQQLVAFIVANREIPSSEIANHLQLILPPALIPSRYIFMDQIPLNSSGKADLRSLEKLASSQVNEDLRRTQPGTEVEIRIAGIWKEILQAEEIYLEDNFFELGGHSLTAIQLVSRLQEAGLGKFSLNDLFRAPTLQSLSRLAQKASSKQNQPILPAPLQPSYPLSDGQRRLWVLDQFRKTEAAYNMSRAFVLHGKVDSDRLFQAFQRLIERHEILRTVFPQIDGEPRQVIGGPEHLHFAKLDWSEIQDQENALHDLARAEFQHAFDLENGPLLRLHWVFLDESKSALLFNIHHIIADGWSVGVIVRELIGFYDGYLEFEPLTLQFRDFVHWQASEAFQAALSQSREFWMKQFAEPLPPLRLPTDFPRPLVKGYKGNFVEYSFSRKMQSGLEKLARRQGGTLFMALLTGVEALLFRYTGQEEMVIGTPVAGRDRPELKNQLGFYVNTLPLRSKIDPKRGFEANLELVKSTTLEAFEHRDYPFDRLVNELDLERDLARSPLFDVMVQLQQFANRPPELRTEDGIKVIPFATELLSSQFDLALDFVEEGDGLRLRLEYDTDLFARSTIERFCQHLEGIFDAALKEPDHALGRLEYFSEKERNQVVHQFNQGFSIPHPQDTFPRKFLQKAQAQPDEIAVCYRKEKITYGQLLLDSRRISSFLHSLKPKSEEVVGLLLDPSPEVLSSILGIQLGGLAWLPLDPRLPFERLKFMVEDASVRTVISVQKYQRLLDQLQWEGNLENYLVLDAETAENVPVEMRNFEAERKVWDHVGQTSEDEITGGGWYSSYTGLPLSGDEMAEYAANVQTKLAPFLDKEARVLEIGCSSGITLMALSPFVKEYVGTDLSAEIIQKTALRVAEKGLKQVTLKALAAHEIEGAVLGKFDLIIINSVIQSFDNLHYLRQVLRQCLSLVTDQGVIFLGDLQDQDLKGEMLADLEEFARENIGLGYRTKTDWSNELFISRGFLDDLRSDFPEVADVFHSLKQGKITNELTRYRFDSILQVDKSRDRKNSGLINRNRNQYFGFHLKNGPVNVPDLLPQPANLACILYTSGSTGQPKGVRLEHRNLLACLLAEQELYDLGPSLITLFLTNYAFDPALLEMFLPLLVGGKVVVPDAQKGLDAPYLNQLIRETGVTDLQGTPGMIRTLLEAIRPGEDLPLKRFCLGGESLDADLVKLIQEKLPDASINNHYGPTEVTVDALALRDIHEFSRNLIGRPLAHARVYLLDSQLQPVPLGIPGQICIGGSGVARDYLNQPELSAEKFIPSPFLPGDRLYLTGDLGRWTEAGEVEFLGRMDRQVKLRGFRLELEEIEVALRRLHGIKEAAVQLQASSQSVVACYQAENAIPEADLVQGLGKKLPQHAIPSRFFWLKEMPLTSGGKISYRDLPWEDSAQQRQITPPQTESQKVLVEIWEEVLGLQGICIHDNFFDLGGHSLSAARLISRIYKQTLREVNLRDIFSFPTVAGLSQLLQKEAKVNFEPIPALAEQTHYRLSAAQQRMWLLNQMEPDSGLYNMPAAFQLEGNVDRERLKNAFAQLLQKHPILRTTYQVQGGLPRQVIHLETNFQFEVFQPGEDDDRYQAILDHFRSEANRPFELENLPMLRVVIAELEENHSLLFINVHHIAGDGWSMRLLDQDFVRFYQQGEEIEKAGPGTSYADFAEWQWQRIGSESGKASRDWWLEQLSLPRAGLDLPTDFARPRERKFTGKTLHFSLPEADYKGMLKLGRDFAATPFVVMTALVNTLLYRLTGTEDIMLGSPVHGRNHPDLEDQIGFFVNTVVLRNRPEAGKKFSEFLAEVREGVAQAYLHQEYPFDLLVDELVSERDLSRNPLFDVMVVWLEEDQFYFQDPEIKVRPLSMDAGTSKFDLTFFFVKSPDGLNLRLEFSIELFLESRIRQWAEILVQLVRETAGNPDVELGFVPLLPEKELLRMLNLGQGPALPDEPEHVLHRFAQRVALHPDKIALEAGSEKWTYADLDRKSDFLARKLMKSGVKRGQIVALRLPRVAEQILAIWAVMKAGAAWLPIDPDYPPGRVHFLLKDSGASCLMVWNEVETDFSVPVFDLQKLNFQGESEVIDLDYRLDQPAYLLYTSGSTGQPKGVIVHHTNLDALTRMLACEFGFSSGQSLLSLTNYTFDVSIPEHVSAFSLGLKVILPTQQEMENPLQLKSLIHSGTNPDILQITPSRLAAFLEVAGMEFIQGFSKVLIAGEAFPPALQEQLLPLKGVQFYNVYGPTEATVYSTFTPLRPGKILIGRPVAGWEALILSPQGELQPCGVAGELWIGGLGLAAGYHGRPELTAEKFGQHPFRAGEKIYRSGDLARWTENGEIEYLGRMDLQVKVRGFRVEPGEIEAALLQIPGITAAAVLADGNLLKAFFTAEKEIAPSVLKAILQEQLPDFMVPSFFGQLEKLPLNASGKVDRNLLKGLEISREVGRSTAGPETPTEAKLAAIWSRALQTEEIGREDNFFVLGGHSLLAMQVLGEVNRVFGIQLPFRQIFKYPTLREMAFQLDRTERNRNEIPGFREKGNWIPLSPAQERMWVLHQMEGDTGAWNMPLIFEVEGNLDPAYLQQSLDQLVARHESLRTFFEEKEGIPGQVVVENQSLGIEEIRGDESWETLIQKWVSFRFDLTRAPLLRVARMIREGENDLLLFNLHHIIGDGVSSQILGEEFFQLYSGYAAQNPVDLPYLSFQYRDFALWQRDWLEGEMGRKQGKWWLEYLSGVENRAELPADFRRPAHRSLQGKSLTFSLANEETQKLKQIARDSQMTLFALLMGLFKVLVYRYSRNKDVVVASPVAGRDIPGTSRQVGLYLNTLVFRDQISGNWTLKELFAAIQENAAEVLENQHYPFEKMIADQNLPRDLSRAPLFDLLFVFNEPRKNQISGGDLHFKPLQLDPGLAKFDLTLTVDAWEEKLDFTLNWSTSLFSEKRMDRMRTHFCRLIEGVDSQINSSVDRLDFLDETERYSLLNDFNSERDKFRFDASIPELFARQVRLFPDKICLIEAETAFTYQQLDLLSSHFSLFLSFSPQKKEGKPVGILHERSALTVVAMLACMKAGIPFLPLDPANPAERIQYMLSDSGCCKVLTVRKFAHLLTGNPDIEVSFLENNYIESQAELSQISTDSPAYLIYTSGSSGRPKGVWVGHESLLNYMQWFNREFEISAIDRTFFIASPGFDASYTYLWSVLCTGGSLVIPRNEEIQDPGLLRELIREKQPTYLKMTPTLFRTLADDSRLELNQLRFLMLGGEAIQTDVLGHFMENFPQVRVCNHYGPTEATIGCVRKWIKREKLPEFLAHPVIGSPIDGALVRILDENDQLQPIGIPGEICLGGACLALGYHDRPDLNEEKFVNDPFANGQKLYRTGDLGRWTEAGEIEFLGRMDAQVKIRGQRIEPGEIELVMAGLDGIESVVVLPWEGNQGEIFLCAYFISGVELHEEWLREELRKQLPSPMIPRYFMRLLAFPQNASGKTDRKRFPRPEIQIQAEASPELPLPGLEEEISTIWAQVLGRNDVGRDSDFFALGGNSLDAIRIIGRVGRQFGVELPVVILFEYSTLARFSAQVRLRGKDFGKLPLLVPVSMEGPRPVSFVQHRMWFMDRLEAGNTQFNLAAMLKLEGKLEVEILRKALEMLVERQAALRTIFPLQNGEPVQVILPAGKVDLQELNLSNLSGEELDGNLLEVAQNEFSRPFDLEKEPGVRFCLIQTGDSEWHLITTLHHIISDARSREILSREVSALYGALLQGKASPLPPLSLQYADFAHWQRQIEAGDHYRASLDFWRERLKGAPAFLDLPTDGQRPDTAWFSGQGLDFELESGLSGDLVRFAREENCTPFMVLMAGFVSLLSRICEADDLLIGVPAANRRAPELEQLIGCFANVLLVRGKMDGAKSFADLVQEVRKQFLEAFEHEDFPFETLIEELNPPRFAGRNTLFQVLVGMLNAPGDLPSLPGLTTSPSDLKVEKTNLDLSVFFQQNGDQIGARILFARELFSEIFILNLMGQFQAFLKSLILDPYLPLWEIPLTDLPEIQGVGILKFPQEKFGFEQIDTEILDQVSKLSDDEIEQLLADYLKE
ncbi:MAG: amino acid adenylation domain-containing protein [Bacteroidia bacterium]|nr:amino acid adenylation domain-containing protein [Bacteroidia bacterium]